VDILYRVGVFPLFLLGAALLAVSLVRGWDQVSTSAIDVTRPDTWDRTVSEASDRMSGIVSALIDVAKDEKRTQTDRVKAIGLLGRIGDKESLDFLLSHSFFVVNLFRESTERGQLRNRPCMYAINKMGRNWAVAQAILRSFDQPKNEREVGYLSRRFIYIMQPEVAALIVSRELAERPTGDREKNLMYLKKRIATLYPAL
jgi:hypothetical protein